MRLRQAAGGNLRVFKWEPAGSSRSSGRPELALHYVGVVCIISLHGGVMASACWRLSSPLSCLLWADVCCAVSTVGDIK